MFTKVDKVILGSLGVVIVTSAVLAISSWGKIQYYQGRIDSALEIRDTLNADREELLKNRREA